MVTVVVVAMVVVHYHNNLRLRRIRYSEARE
jgi:hypothetical protein